MLLISAETLIKERRRKTVQRKFHFLAALGGQSDKFQRANYRSEVGFSFYWTFKSNDPRDLKQGFVLHTLARRAKLSD